MTKQFSLLQLFNIVDGRLATTMGDVYNILNHVCNDNLMTHHLPVAMNYIKLKNPKWYDEVEGYIIDVKSKCGGQDFESITN